VTVIGTVAGHIYFLEDVAGIRMRGEQKTQEQERNAEKSAESFIKSLLD